jgi:Fe(3+) dicitrate transport protein
MSFAEKSDISLPVQLAYTYTEAYFLSSFDSEFEGWGSVEEGDELPYLAKHQFSFLIGLEYKRWHFNTSIRYMDEMRTQPGHGNIPDNQKTDAYLVTDLSLNVKIQKEISLFGNLTNLTDEVYIVARRPAGLRPGMPRSFNVGVKALF